jgi:hypothetical protein
MSISNGIHMKKSLILVFIFTSSLSAFCQLNKIDELYGYKDFIFNMRKDSVKYSLRPTTFENINNNDIYMNVYCKSFYIDNYPSNIGAYKVSQIELFFLCDSLKKIKLTMEGSQIEIQKILEYNFGKPNISSRNESIPTSSVESYIWKAEKITLDHNYYLYHFDDKNPSKVVELHTVTFCTNDYNLTLGKIKNMSLEKSLDDFKSIKKK